jgi:hypothetical protein
VSTPFTGNSLPIFTAYFPRVAAILGKDPFPKKSRWPIV